MATAYELLRSKVEPLGSNPNYQQSVNTLLTNGLHLSLKEVYEVPHCNSPEIYCFRNLLVFLRYLAEAPKGSDFGTLNEEYVSTFGCIPSDCKTEVVSFISSMYFGGISKELDNVEQIGDFQVWFERYGFLKSNNVEMQLFENKLSMNFRSKLWSVFNQPEKDIQKCIECAIMINFAQSKEFNVGDTLSLFISTIYSHLTMKYEMYNGGERKNLQDVSNLVYYMKYFKIEGDSETYQIKQLEDFFGVLAPVQKPDEHEKDFERDPNLPYTGIDFSTLLYKATVYASVSNPNFNINIHHYSCSVKGEVGLKLYEIKNPNYDKNKIKNEVDILETLSAKSAQSTCFIKCYGSHWEQDKIYIAMEYFKDTLMAKISEMRNNKQIFTEAHMIYYARELISAHALMEQLGIYHQDIKPQNILFTPNNLLKIIDFSVSVSKSYDEVTLAATGLHFIQGTQGYMAPELQAHALTENRTKIIYSRPKADVFSLGLVLLQMFTLEELHTLNMKENNHLLMNKIEKLPFTWFQTLLKNMLQVDYKIRVSFKSALNFIPGRATTQ